MQEFHIGKKELVAFFIILLAAFGLWHYPEKSTLADFSPAIQIRDAVLGTNAPLHISLAWMAEGVFAALAGQPASSPEPIISFLLFFPSALLALSAAMLYLALRAFGYRKAVSAFAALLFTLSLSTSQFLPGTFVSAQIAALFFSAFALSFAAFKKGGNPVLLALSILFAALSGYTNPAFGIASFALTASFALASSLRNENADTLKMSAIAFAALLPAIISPELAGMGFGIENVIQFITYYAPFLAAPAFCAGILFFTSNGRHEHLFLILGSMIAASASPLAGAMLIVIPAAEGAQKIIDENLSKESKLLAAFALAFVTLLGVAGMDSELPRALAIAFTLSFMLPLGIHFYGYDNRKIFSAFMICLLGISVFFPIFAQFTGNMRPSLKYSDMDMNSALLSLSKKDVGAVSGLGDGKAMQFYLPTATIGDKKNLADYLMKGTPKPESGSRLVLSLSDFDSGGDEIRFEGFEIYRFQAETGDASRKYAAFLSGRGKILFREMDQDGSLLLKDATIFDTTGRPIGNAPLSRMVFLARNESFSWQYNRLVVLQEGEKLPFFLDIYNGNVNGLEIESQAGKVSVFKVK